MARVTVEDCVRIVPNRFELVLLASQRARDISAGMQLSVERDNDKNPVVALREIAEQSIDFSEVRRHIVGGVNRHADLNMEDDEISLISQEAIATMGMDETSDIQEIEFEEEQQPTTEVSGEPTEDEVEEAVAEEDMIEVTEEELHTSVDQEMIAPEDIEEQV